MSKTITATVEGSSVELGFDKEAREALKAFAEAKALEAEAKKQKDLAEVILRAKLGLNEVATFGGVPAFKIEHRNRQDLDRKVLKDAFPEAYEKSLYANPYDFISAIVR
jgi:hypothetical protein